MKKVFVEPEIEIVSFEALDKIGAVSYTDTGEGWGDGGTSDSVPGGGTEIEI